MTSIKPDERVDVGVRRDDRWRKMHGEPRVSHETENTFAETAHHRQQTDTRNDLQQRIIAINHEIGRIEEQLGKAAPGDHRGYIREIRHGLNGITKALRNRYNL